jgi:hypothetical protein
MKLKIPDEERTGTRSRALSPADKSYPTARSTGLTVVDCALSLLEQNPTTMIDRKRRRRLKTGFTRESRQDRATHALELNKRLVKRHDLQIPGFREGGQIRIAPQLRRMLYSSVPAAALEHEQVKSRQLPRAIL